MIYLPPITEKGKRQVRGAGLFSSRFSSRLPGPSTPSPLAGEGWDGGEKCGMGTPPAFTPTLTLPHLRGREKTDRHGSRKLNGPVRGGAPSAISTLQSRVCCITVLQTTTRPRDTTSRGVLRARMSCSGLPCTASKSAAFPAAMTPRSLRPSASAATDVADLSM